MAGKKIKEADAFPQQNDFVLERDPLFPLKGYFILNAVFWAYCVIQLLVVTWLFRDIVGLVFFFAVLGIGFTLVSFYDYLYDRFSVIWSEFKGFFLAGVILLVIGGILLIIARSPWKITFFSINGYALIIASFYCIIRLLLSLERYYKKGDEK